MEHENTTDSDRDPKTGKFLPGNRAMQGKKNPSVARSNALRAAVLSELTPNKFRLVVNSMLRKALSGNVAAAELLFRYGLGPAVNFDLLERVRAVERAAGIETLEDFDEPLSHPALDYEIGEDGRTLRAIRRRPTPIRDFVNDGDEQDGDSDE